MDIVKAEILFSRKCNLKCSFCSMGTNQENTLSIEEWKTAILKLKEFGCKFCGFYGAEPMLEFEKLKEVVGFTEEQGINTTVITSGVGIPNFRDKLRELHSYGAKSLSMSVDLLPYCESSERKSRDAVEHLEYFKSLGGVRDVAAITVLTKENYKLLPNMVLKMYKKDIWTFFDIIHEDVGHPGTKCSGKGGTLMFKKTDLPFLFKVLDLVQRMKNQGMLVHNNQTFCDEIKNNGIYNWSCARHKEFPSWLTIDCDGRILPCDDFNVPSKWYIHTIKNEEIPNMVETFRQSILDNKCTCAWNTHIGAHSIKAGKDSIKDYIHGEW